MQAKGHSVETWTPNPFFYKIPFPKKLKKWLGYMDQYILFPIQVKRKIKKIPDDTLFVFSDHALGPWVPLVSKRPHVIHCHDFLAQRNALGEFIENRIKWTGRKYQAFIRKGFSSGQNFISISQKSRNDLHKLLKIKPVLSEVVYNGLTQKFTPLNVADVRLELSETTGIDLSKGYLLHIGGNQWYKNRKAVIQLYNAWYEFSKDKLPLLLIGEKPDRLLYDIYKDSNFKNKIHFLIGKDNSFVIKAYAGATIFLFPSLAEGFGWPIAEAMASACPVITTDEAPMNEVGGDAAIYIKRYPSDKDKNPGWIAESSGVIEKTIGLREDQRQQIIETGLKNAARFNPEFALNKIEAIYKDIIIHNS
jgi:glycosyltransferase involved in cell wall biosynthesis